MSEQGLRESLLEGFRTSGRDLPGARSWSEGLRRDAIERFERVGLPGAKEELWRHTSLDSLRSIPFHPGARASSEVPPELAEAVGEAYRVRVAPSGTAVLAENGGLPAGLRIADLGEDPAVLQGRLAALASAEADAFIALNTALFDRGVRIEIGAGTVLERPVHVVHCLEADAASGGAAFPRVLVVAGRGSRAVVVEHYASRGEGASFTAPVSEIFVEEGAELDHVRLQEESGSAFHVARVVAEQGRATRLRSFSFALGSRLARADIEARLAGEGAQCALQGLFVGGGAQHLDHYTRIDHRSPHTRSRECYKGILAGRARGVFLGHILVRPGAQKIDALQTSRSVVLSDHARVNMKPWLEIYADDVRCTHGTTVGRLDADALFYLRSRGISLEEARAILVRAFASEVLEALPLPRLREYLAEATLASALDGVLGERG